MKRRYGVRIKPKRRYCRWPRKPKNAKPTFSIALTYSHDPIFKACPDCGIVIAIRDFSGGYCAECNRKRCRLYYIENAEYLRRKSLEHNHSHRKEYARYRDINRDVLRERSRKYKATPLEKAKTKARLSYRRSVLKSQKIATQLTRIIELTTILRSLESDTTHKKP